MKHLTDRWYVRLPDGRIVRAANTSLVRRQVRLGRIPFTSSVRRSKNDEWAALEWTREFADLVKPPPQEEKTDTGRPDTKSDLDVGALPPEPAAASGLSARLDRNRLPTIGVRGMMHELLAALDSTLVRKKLAAAALAGLCVGVVLACGQLPALAIESEAPWARGTAVGILALIIVTAAAGLLTRMTFRELSRMRPARWREGFAGLTRTTFRIVVAQLLTAGVAMGAIIGLRMLPGLLLDVELGGGPAAAAAALGMILEVVLWPVVGFSLLLPPILVVENCSIRQALGHWLRLLRQDLGRVFLYEALALGLGLAATLLLAIPWMALFTYQHDPRLLSTVGFTRWVLAGLAGAPLLAYLMVANVFIYINLRYESGRTGRR